jgi:hypothetical protein
LRSIVFEASSLSLNSESRGNKDDSPEGLERYRKFAIRRIPSVGIVGEAGSENTTQGRAFKGTSS